MPRALAAIVAALAVALPRLALACPVCMAADARRTDAYVATTVLLSLLPLAAIGGIAWLVWRRSGTREVVEAHDPGDAPRRPRPQVPRLHPEP